MFGYLLSGGYKSLIVDGSGRGYLKTVCDCVHLSPTRVKLVATEAPLRSFVCSSWPAYLAAPWRLPGWLRVDRLLGEYGITKDSPAGRQRLERALEERQGAQAGEEFTPIRRGWCLGSAAFRQELLTQMRERIGPEHYGEERAQTAEALAEEVTAEELKRRGWRETDLQARRKGDPGKVALAARLRAETTMPAGWIAERLSMGSRGYLHHLL